MDILDETEELDLDPIEITEDLKVAEYFDYIGLTRKDDEDDLEFDDIQLPF